MTDNRLRIENTRKREMEKIPHIIHYCWFGGGKMNPEAQACIEGWKERLPDYHFIEWNETNFQTERFPYARTASEAGKYAFVSDVARIWALYTCGGVYLDTDVEVCRDFSHCLEEDRAVFGFEYGNRLMTAFMAAVPGHPLIGEMLDYYEKIPFRPDEDLEKQANTILLTRLAKERGLVCDNSSQELTDGIRIWPEEYFSAYRLRSEQAARTENTYTIHHYSASWMPASVRVRKKVKHMIRACLGQDMLDKILEKGRERNRYDTET